MRIENAVAIVLLLALAACSREKSAGEQARDGLADMQSTTERLQNLPADQDQAAAELQAIGRELQAKADAAKAQEREAVADACAFLDEADAAELVGSSQVKREPMPRLGSSWGGCNFVPEEISLASMGKVRMLMVNLRPAGEFERTVEYQRSKGTGREVAGLDGSAWVDGTALLWQPPGKPWFLVVAGGPMGRTDTDFVVDAAGRMRL